MPAGKRLTREEKKAQTRERLIDAAAKVFARKGFAATTLDEVAEEAGLTKGAVYSNFENKDDLVRAVLDARHQRMLDISERVHEGSLEEMASEASKLFDVIEAQERDAFLLLLEFVVYAVRNPDLHPNFLARHLAAQGEIGKIIRQFEGERPLFSAPEQARIFDAIGNGFALEKLIDPTGVPDDLFARVIAVLWGAFNSFSDLEEVLQVKIVPRLDNDGNA